MIRWDGNGRMSIYFRVSQIFTPSHSVHLRYLCLSVHRPSCYCNVRGGSYRGSLEIHLEAMTIWTWRPKSDKCGGRNRGSFERHWTALIEEVWRCTWRLRSSEIEDALWRPWSTEIGWVPEANQLGGSSSGGRCEGSWHSIYSITCNCWNAEN